MGGANALGLAEVGNGAGNLEDVGSGTGGEPEFDERGVEEIAACRVKPAESAHVHVAHSSVGSDRAKASDLEFPGSRDSRGHTTRRRGPGPRGKPARGLEEPEHALGWRSLRRRPTLALAIYEYLVEMRQLWCLSRRSHEASKVPVRQG